MSLDLHEVCKGTPGKQRHELIIQEVVVLKIQGKIKIRSLNNSKKR